MLKYFALILLSFSLFSEARALNHIDTFVRDHCGSRCTGETDDCRICYNEAVDLYDQATPDSAEVSWDNGKIEFSF